MISRTLPMQQQRRDNVDDIELSLLQHQLALFPHLEESVPPEVRHEVTKSKTLHLFALTH
jgi:hypothetical protein